MLSSTSQKTSDSKIRTKIFWNRFLWFACGMLWGIVLLFICGSLYLRHNLIMETPLYGSFPSITSALPKAAEPYGWTVSDGNSCGLPRMVAGYPLQTFRFCKRSYALELLKEEQDRKLACLLPCTAAIYRKADGVTYSARLNMPLITLLLGSETNLLFRRKILPEQSVIFLKADPPVPESFSIPHLK